MRVNTIMVVDDEEQLLDFFAQGFALRGYNVLAARNAEEAIRMLQDIPCSIFFIDLNLPGMNGIELCKYIRERFPLAIPFAITGHDAFFELGECRDAGFDDYFTKPVPLSDLLDAAMIACIKLKRWRDQQQSATVENHDCWSLRRSIVATPKST